MSDEYQDRGQYKGSLVQESVKDTIPTNGGNYPPPGDTTSEGGYGGDALSQRAQRGIDNTKVQTQPSNEPSDNSSTSRGSPNSFSATGLQATEEKSTDYPGFEHPAPASGNADRRREAYESAAAGTVDSTEAGG